MSIMALKSAATKIYLATTRDWHPKLSDACMQSLSVPKIRQPERSTNNQERLATTWLLLHKGHPDVMQNAEPAMGRGGAAGDERA